ncbi:Stk1 family PASTA domain-containing Ser/Thr kinase [Kitasatospora sp. NPDC088548]|uniref:Stk1 family PASTA domain-containing Ser/Thr kinase n=1 Tax=Kitasatospora sp. NPDC088548 TaxID=3364075 RepID=UPI0037FCE793
MEEPRRLGGRYELGGVLGRGGMAEVYLGHDTRLGRSVAVKTLRADMARDPSFQARFRREAQSAASLNHPAIVAVYDTGEDYIDGISIPYIVMEYVEGSTLRELLHSGRRLLPERALEMTIGILQALEYSHRAGIVHRDIKPANVMLTRQGNVKVMDFGIARAMGDAGMTMTQTSAVIGTAQYLSPEQAKGEQVDARSDLYSTGCLLYELLTVRPPFVGDSPVAVAYQHVREEAQPPSVFDPEVRPEIDAIVLKALAKDRDYRYQSADEMRDDIERFLDGLPVAAAQQAAAYGMGAAGYGYDQNGYPQQQDPYGQTNVLPQQPGAGPTTVLPHAGGQPGYGQQAGYPDDGYGQTYAGAPGGGSDDGYGRGGGRRGEEPPKKSNTSWIVLAVAAVLVLVGTFFVAQAMFGGKKDDTTKEPPKIAAPNLVGKSLADAKAAAVQAGPKLVVTEGEKIACPDTNIKKDQVCTQNPAAPTQVAETATITVQLSSGPAKSNVPSVVGKTKDAAIKALADAGFTNVLPEYKDDDTAPQEQVIAQDPAANAAGDPTAQVKLTISQGKAKTVVPSVLGQQKEAAQAALESAGFQVDASKTTLTNDPTKVNTVASQSLQANSKVPANSKIVLTIYKAPDKATVPALQNVPLKDAIKQLQDAGLGFSVSGPQDPNAVVTGVNPPAGTKLDPNTQVTLMTRPADPAKGDTPNPPPTKGGNP